MEVVATRINRSSAERCDISLIYIYGSLLHGNESLSLAERGLKRRKLNGTEPKYMNLHFLHPTSNMCERLFSVAGYALSDRTKSIVPMNFERQISLHVNSHLWNVDSVNSLLNQEKES